MKTIPTLMRTLFAFTLVTTVIAAFADTERMQTIEVNDTRLERGSCGNYCSVYSSYEYDDSAFAIPVTTTVSWNDPAVPRCSKEEKARDEFNGAFLAYQQGNFAGAPPGKQIMSGPFGDAAFQGPGWGKYDFNVILRERSAPNLNVVSRYSIHIHYMYNTTTGQLSQVRFKSSYDAACVGTQSAA